MLKTIVAGCAMTTMCLSASLVLAEDKKALPTEGYAIHVMAPHKMEDGTIAGPHHHYCKPVSKEILQCQLYESTDPNAHLIGVEYFVEKNLARKNMKLELWNKHYHDHAVEIATGRVQVLDMEPDKAKEVAEAAGKTDGIVFLLWPHGAPIPTGEVHHPQSVGHKHRTE